MTLCEVIGQNNQSLSSSLYKNNTLTYEDCRQMCATDDKTFATLLVRKAVNYKINRFIARSNRSNLFCAIYFFQNDFDFKSINIVNVVSYMPLKSFA